MMEISQGLNCSRQVRLDLSRELKVVNILVNGVPPFSVKRIAFRKFNNFRIFWKFSREISVTYYVHNIRLRIKMLFTRVKSLKLREKLSVYDSRGHLQGRRLSATGFISLRKNEFVCSNSVSIVGSLLLQ